ncbi:MAG: MmgE/PrpD family protein, partial [Alphaproteobacteria bacterium]|nr:MmgE/PrpD family protein [Alphaproteobacteria bacterium]
VYGDRRRAPLRLAALINGTASHLVEFDDIFRDAIYHPGSPTIAAAIAAAQERGASGELLLRAIVVGYEISTRIGVAVNPAHYRFWHTTGTVGTFGAAAAVGTVLGLDSKQMAHALANAATMAAGLQQAFRSDANSKPLHAGHAAEAGALAAMLAGEGFTGALDALEGEAGFGAALGGKPDWSRATADLGRRYNVTAMTFKNHGCCGHAFAAIDGALLLAKRHGLGPENIRAVRVGSYRAALEVAGMRDPRTAFQGKFSVPYVVASALVHGSVRLDAFAPKRLFDPPTRALMARLTFELDAEAEAAFPGRRSAMVEIETADGQRFRHRQLHRKGDPEEPLSDAELEAKFHELAVPVLGRTKAARLLAEIEAIDGAKRVGLAPAFAVGSGR